MEWIFSCGYIFKQDHYIMGFFTCKSQYGAKLRIFYAAINKCNFVSKCGNYNDLYKNMEKMGSSLGCVV